MPSIEFTAREATVHKAIVVSFDLGGFSDFCNQPEPSVAVAAPQLIKRVFDLLNGVLSARDESSWLLIRSADDRTLPIRNSTNSRVTAR